MALTLVTGASNGLGTVFARLAAAEGSDLVLVARSHAALEILAQDLRAAHGVAVTVLAEDLADASSIHRIVTALALLPHSVDTLISNAGVGMLAPFAETPPEHIETMLGVNMTALTRLTRALLPDMVERKRGRILNIASTAAFQPGPLMATYYATKAYVLSWSLALRNELAGSGVTVTCLCPGPTRTGFQAHAGMADAPLLKRFHTMDADTVARRGYDGLLHGRAIVVPGFMNKLSVLGTRLIPRTLAARLARMAQGVG